MAEATKSTYQKQRVSTWTDEIKRQSNRAYDSRLKLTRTFILGFFGIAFMAVWLILSIQTDYLLLGEIIPAFIIITALLFIRAFDNSNS